MGNNGKSLTNVSFRAKILEVIDKLKDQNKTALVHHVDDFEALNKDTFEAGMNALVEAIPAPPAGSGGSGSSDYVVTFGMDFENEEITCDKEIDDIIAHANKHIVGRFVIKDFPLEDGVTLDIYCDNLKFDYQQLKSDNPEFSSAISAYTYLGFSGDGIIFSAFDGEPLGNVPLDDEETLYCKTNVAVYYIFGDENPHWEFDTHNLGQQEMEIEYINFPFDDHTKGFIHKWTVNLLNTPDSNGGNAETYIYGYRGEQVLLNQFMPPDSSYSDARRTALYSPTIYTNYGINQLCIYSKAAQVEVCLRDESDSIFDAIFTINRCSIRNNEIINGNIVNGYVEMFCDEVDDVNNRIIRHFIRVEVIGDLSVADNYRPKTTYKKLFIPYTVA